MTIEFEQIAVLYSNGGETVTCLLRTPYFVREVETGRMSDGVVNCRFIRELSMIEIIVGRDCGREFEIDFTIEFDADKAHGLPRPGTASGTMVCSWEGMEPEPEIDFAEITRMVSTGGVL